MSGERVRWGGVHASTDPALSSESRRPGGGGYWAAAVLLAIGLCAAGAFTLYKFKRQGRWPPGGRVRAGLQHAWGVRVCSGRWGGCSSGPSQSEPRGRRAAALSPARVLHPSPLCRAHPPHPSHRGGGRPGSERRGNVPRAPPGFPQQPYVPSFCAPAAVLLPARPWGAVSRWGDCRGARGAGRGWREAAGGRRAHRVVSGRALAPLSPLVPGPHLRNAFHNPPCWDRPGPATGPLNLDVPRCQTWE